MQLDTIDLNILTLLQQNGRISNQDLAEQVFLSPSSCLRRVRILEEAGIISRYSAVLSPEKLGLELDVFVQVTMRRDVESWHENFMQVLQDYPEVVGSYIITGDANYLLRVKARNLKHYSAFVLEKLYKIPGVQDIRSNIVLQAIKETYELPRELLRDG
ncbi:Lrp/AsnC family transcriptional regulator [Collimonas fungivorans]|uniref:Transcriptional regulator, AsnC family n=1 Tax=Collimonas fungivorans (strain Ter331) TaxID=1005048 RepID=G0AAD0_COLFT|nr:Lrp/AsnC family transcriptional regulator [Collimonas fungivorans]AEK63144.1 transcriptional regulator, AsnC family [Collimonas fungivorans Ter331]